MELTQTSKLEIQSDGERLLVSEIMQRFRNDGSCERLIRESLVSFAATQSMEPSPVLLELTQKLQAYSKRHIDVTDDSDLYHLIMNLPIVRDLQKRVNGLMCEVTNMQEARRFLEDAAKSFCTLWNNFKEVTKDGNK